MDFRTEAASATLDALGDSSASALAASPESGCVSVPGGHRVHKLIALPPLLLAGIGLLGTVTILVLRFSGHFSGNQMVLALMPFFAISLLVRTFKSLIVAAYLRSRPLGFPRLFSELPHRAFGLEDGLTCHKTKVFIEDSGICFFDERQQRVLLEGCEYRYIIRAKDVLLVEPISRYSLSGARVTCRMRDGHLNIALTAAGQGPLASFIQAFAPSQDALGLAKQLNRTFFGSDVPAYRQNALPPLLPGA